MSIERSAFVDSVQLWILFFLFLPDSLIDKQSFLIDITQFPERMKNLCHDNEVCTYRHIPVLRPLLCELSPFLLCTLAPCGVLFAFYCPPKAFPVEFLSCNFDSFQIYHTWKINQFQFRSQLHLQLPRSGCLKYYSRQIEQFHYRSQEKSFLFFFRFWFLFKAFPF